MEPIFSIKNFFRKPEFSISTIGYVQTTGKIIFKKYATCPQAVKHIRNIYSNHLLLSKKTEGFDLRVIEPLQISKDGSWVSFDYTSGQSLEKSFISMIIDLDVVNQKKNITTLQKRLVPTSLVSNPALPNITISKSSINPTILDLNLDNIILDGGTMKLIDCEWVSSSSVSAKQVITRAIYYALQKSSGLLRAHQERLDLLEDIQGVLIPKFIFENNILYKKDLLEVINMENDFQKLVQIRSSRVKIKEYSFKEYQSSKPFGDISSMEQKVSSCESAMEDILESNSRTEIELQSIISGLKIENQRLNSIIHSPAKFSKHAAKFILKKVKR